MIMSLHPSFIFILCGLSFVMFPSEWFRWVSYRVPLLVFVLFVSFSGTGTLCWQEFAFLFVAVLSNQHNHLCLNLTYLDLFYPGSPCFFLFCFLFPPSHLFVNGSFFSYCFTQREIISYFYSFSDVLENLIGYL